MSSILSLIHIFSHGEDLHPLLLPVHLQLLDGCRAVDVAGYQKRLLALQLELARKLGPVSYTHLDVYKRQVLIPAIKECIREVSVPEGRMKIRLMDGLI